MVKNQGLLHCAHYYLLSELLFPLIDFLSLSLSLSLFLSLSDTHPLFLASSLLSHSLSLSLTHSRTDD